MLLMIKPLSPVYMYFRANQYLYRFVKLWNDLECLKFNILSSHINRELLSLFKFIDKVRIWTIFYIQKNRIENI